jgi:Fe-Mn family superoxide dismutase
MFPFPKLPYEPDALEPVLSAEAVNEHYGKHHRKYYDNLKLLIDNTRFEEADLITIIRETKNPITFNNAAQVYNHDIWWNSLSPSEQEMPENLQKSIFDTYDNMDNFREVFEERAKRHFGSGWIWLVRAEDEVEWWTLHDADTPIKTPGVTPLLTVDLWEHAWYIDYKSNKADYLSKIFDILNWEYANENLAKSM